MKKQPTLLRRPLPPKLPKLPLHKKKARRAKAIETEQDVKLAQDKATSVKEDKSLIPDVASGNQSQAFLSVQNLCIDQHIQEKRSLVKLFPTSKKSLQDICFHIPATARGSIFFPTCHSASARVFGKEISQIESLRQSKRQLSKVKSKNVDERLQHVLILNPNFSKPFSDHGQFITTTDKVFNDKYPPKISAEYTSEIPLIDLSTAMQSPLPSVLSSKPEKQPSDHLLRNTPVVLNISDFPGPIVMPPPVIPRKPQRHSIIENLIVENEAAEDLAPKQRALSISQAPTKTKKREEADANVVLGEGFKIFSTTQYETIVALTNLAILNCQIYGRNALNFKGFFILDCPDLTPLAFQLIYLNLSFNDIRTFPSQVFCLKNLQILKLRNNPIKEIPSDIENLKYLQVLIMAFNLLTSLPPGLFNLPYLEELDVSYNGITSIPNEIQNLRSLEKLSVNGNELTSFPSGMLKLNLRKILFDNNYTHPHFWKENSFNSPQQLKCIASSFFYKNNLQMYYDVIPEKVQKLLIWTSCCEWCQGPMFDKGFRIIQPCNVFGATQFPIMFHVCSSTCYAQVKQSS
ncbi:PREDICTED: leucine-rich repeat-containing protein 63 [Chrysochloris asiatica]|uniref:Leucine-rich repeat-containing protein 63 n=1 Tax=Chrysochloris asiatica TaxID=185453 RepID=A0A9B0TCY9_CHRAS|nr:PREDICTED: leucine-rich repeat-containing protein 63 [Chrysochloris asiatica]